MDHLVLCVHRTNLTIDEAENPPHAVSMWHYLTLQTNLNDREAFYQISLWFSLAIDTELKWKWAINSYPTYEIHHRLSLGFSFGFYTAVTWHLL